MMRSRYAGSLRPVDTGESVALCGWVANRRDHGSVIFVDLRDAEGLAQVVIDPSRESCADGHALRNEFVIRVEGTVRARPPGTVNDSMPTGEVEVDVESLEILSAAEPLPFQVDDRIEVDEALRLRHRYLDLRRARMQRNLRLRARVVAAVRRSMETQGFVDVETPTLTRSTPEGARDFLVPSRLQPGSFYALPQSPQLFKQLLMVGGVDRYFQIAHCWRDEDLRADRAPEFTQLDTEMSFAGPDDVMDVIEQAVVSAVEEITGSRPARFDRITWEESMTRYGTDKPDRRFGTELHDCSALFADAEFRAFSGRYVVAIRLAGGADTSRSALDAWTDTAQTLGAGGLVWMRVRDTELESPVAKFISADEQFGLRSTTGAEAGDLLLIVADGDRRLAQRVLGALRLELGRPERTDVPLDLCWVVDFPLFEGVADGVARSAHHPFTAPHPDDVDLLESDPLAVRSLAYDLVCNGFELGSGSVRIHDRVLQQRCFQALGIDEAEAQSRFGFLLDAFRYGVPPHAGFAFGIDRLAMILAGEHSLRDVVAFPKTQTGSDPLTGAPAPVDDTQLGDVGISVLSEFRPDVGPRP
ncbi:MAG: aspartate--tRNA ligase [Acidimicrobiia bacterium]